jgi:two-component system, sensor histidine kinase
VVSLPGPDAPGGDAPRETSGAHPYLDHAALEGLSQMAGGRALSELLERFLDGVPVRIHRMRHALATRDTEHLTLLAHSLKGTASTYGAAALAGRAAEVEDHALSGDLKGAARALGGLEGTLATTQAAVTTAAADISG